MIRDRKVFEYEGNPLIEKVTIKLPFRYEALFQNEGCFLSIKGSKSAIYSSVEKVNIKSKEAVLLRCGTYFVDFIKNETSQEVDVIAIHLYPEVIKALYKTELPKSMIEHVEGGQINRVLTDELLEKFIDNIYFYFENPQLINKDMLELKLKELILILIQSSRIDSIHKLIS